MHRLRDFQKGSTQRIADQTEVAIEAKGLKLKIYLFSIFARIFLAFSGFVVFIVSAHIFGADGRGIIAYGTSLFAAVGIVLSLSLGKVFIGNTLKDESLKRELLPNFLAFNVFISFLTSVSGVIYWYFSDSAKSILDIKQILCFSLLSLFYIWFHNGHPFFSAFSRNKTQDSLIFGTRVVLLIFLGLFWLSGSQDISLFIVGYSAVLFLGALLEILILKSAIGVKANFTANWRQWKTILKLSWWPHVDYISFNIFPLFAMVISASSLSKAELGLANFAVQMVNLVFLLSTTANVRIASYVANFGFSAKIGQIKKLFLFTLVGSFLGVICIHIGLLIAKRLNLFTSFLGVSDLFLILSLAIPGFLSYQFLNPLWIEMNKLKKSAIFNVVNLGVCILLLPFALSSWGVRGLMYDYSLFFSLVFLGNVFIWVQDARSRK